MVKTIEEKEEVEKVIDITNTFWFGLSLGFVMGFLSARLFFDFLNII